VEKDAPGIRAVAHQIKGSSGNLRINMIYERAIELEAAAIKGELENCKGLITRLKNILK
jgi:two-component system, sensor histidine kinase and response regulator